MPAAIATMRAGGRINAAQLLYFDFKDQPMFTFMGFGEIKSLDGQTWKGTGDAVSIEGIGQVAGTIANNVTVRLAHNSDVITDPAIQRTINSSTLVKGRRFFTAIQFMDEAWQPLGQFLTTFVGVMDKMTVHANADLREIILNVENPLVRRRIARPSNFDDRDQKSLYPNDRAFEFISGLKNKTVQWPRF
jgi:hypothetical protein